MFNWNKKKSFIEEAVGYDKPRYAGDILTTARGYCFVGDYNELGGLEWRELEKSDFVKNDPKNTTELTLTKTGTRRSKKVDVPTESWQKSIERESDTLKEKWNSTEGKINRLFCSSTLTTERLDRLEKLIEKLEKDM